MIAALWARIWPYLAAIGVALAALLAIRQSGKSAGKTEAKIEQLEADQKAAGAAREVRQKNDALDDAAIRVDATKWVRGNKR